ncbi:hypothetical protein EH165_02425 [Nakamurella antarctica]|uniref:Uncharacterized protein n=1 Tax=Nakamurella antarctica TaxID=1902245 RepID=A0A3G8ZIY4_9ACTN|nr:hypothetical protein [Nakamurella antarctica]AZI57180.1 hypothetical protein EH165_02425 [Nakamurella antarctica]
MTSRRSPRLIRVAAMGQRWGSDWVLDIGYALEGKMSSRVVLRQVSPTRLMPNFRLEYRNADEVAAIDLIWTTV